MDNGKYIKRLKNIEGLIPLIDLKCGGEQKNANFEDKGINYQTDSTHVKNVEGKRFTERTQSDPVSDQGAKIKDNGGHNVEDAESNKNEKLTLNGQNDNCNGHGHTESNGKDTLMLNCQNAKECHSVGQAEKEPNMVNTPRDKGFQNENDLVIIEDNDTNQKKPQTISDRRDSGCQSEPSSDETDRTSEQRQNSLCARTSTCKNENLDGSNKNLDNLTLNKDILDQMITSYINFNKKDRKFVELLQKFVVHMRKHRLIDESSHSKTLHLNTSCQTSGDIEVFARPLKSLLGQNATRLGLRRTDLKSEILFNLENIPEGTTYEICARLILNHSPLEVRHLFNSLYRRVQNELNQDQETFHSVTESSGNNKEVTRYSLGWQSNANGESGRSENEDDDTNISDQQKSSKCEKVGHATFNLCSGMRRDPVYLHKPTLTSRQVQPIRPLPQKVYCCLICDLETLTKEELKRHAISAHSNQPFYVNNAGPNISSRYYRYNCVKCKFVTKSKAMIYHHIKYIHPAVNTRRSNRKVLKSRKNRFNSPETNLKPSKYQINEISNQLLPAPTLGISSTKENDHDDSNRTKTSAMVIDLSDRKTSGKFIRLNETSNNKGQTDISNCTSDYTERIETVNNTRQTETSKNIAQTETSNNIGYVEISNNKRNNTRETQTEEIAVQIEILQQKPSTSGTYLFLPYRMTEIDRDVARTVDMNSELPGIVEIGSEVAGVIEIGEKMTGANRFDREVADIAEIDSYVQATETIQSKSTYESNGVSRSAVENVMKLANVVKIDSDSVQTPATMETTSTSELNDSSCFDKDNDSEIAHVAKNDLSLSISKRNILPPFVTEKNVDVAHIIKIDSDFIPTSYLIQNASGSLSNNLTPLTMEKALKPSRVAEIDSAIALSISPSNSSELSQFSTENSNGAATTGIDSQFSESAPASDINEVPKIVTENEKVAARSNIDPDFAESASASEICELSKIVTENSKDAGEIDIVLYTAQTTSASESNLLPQLSTENLELEGIFGLDSDYAETSTSQLNILPHAEMENHSDVVIIHENDSEFVQMTHPIQTAFTSELNDSSLLGLEKPEVTGITTNSDVKTTLISELNDSTLVVTKNPKVISITDIDPNLDEITDTIQSAYSSELNGLQLSDTKNLDVTSDFDQMSKSMIRTPSLESNALYQVDLNNDLSNKEPNIINQFKENRLIIKVLFPHTNNHEKLCIDLSCPVQMHLWLNNVKMLSIPLSNEVMFWLRSGSRMFESRVKSSNCNHATSSQIYDSRPENLGIQSSLSNKNEHDEQLIGDNNDLDESHCKKVKEAFKARFEALLKCCQELILNDGDKDEDESSETSFYSVYENCDVNDIEPEEYNDYKRTMLDSDYESDEDQAFYDNGSTQDLNNYEILLNEQFQFRSDSEVMISDETFDQYMHEIIDISRVNIDVNALLNEFNFLYIVSNRTGSFINNRNNNCDVKNHVKDYIYECNYFAIRYNDMLNTFKPFNLYFRHYGSVAINVFKLVQFSFAFAFLINSIKIKKEESCAFNNKEKINRSKNDHGGKGLNPSENKASTSDNCHPATKIKRIPPKRKGKDKEVPVAEGNPSNCRNLGRDFFEECFGVDIPCNNVSEGCRGLDKVHSSKETNAKRQDNLSDVSDYEHVRILRSGLTLDRTKLTQKYGKVSFRSDHLQNDNGKTPPGKIFPEDSNLFHSSGLVVEGLGSDDEIDVLQKKYLDNVSKPQMKTSNFSRSRNRPNIQHSDYANKNRQSDDSYQTKRHKMACQVRSSQFCSHLSRDCLVSPGTVDQDDPQVDAIDPDNESEERAGVECSFGEYLKNLKRRNKINREETNKEEIPHEEDCMHLSGPSGIKTIQVCNCNDEKNDKEDVRCRYCSRAICSNHSHMDSFIHDCDREITVYKKNRKRKKLFRLFEEYSFQCFLKICFTTVQVLVGMTERYIHKFFKKAAVSKEIPDLNYRILEVMSLRLINMTLCFRGFAEIIKKDYWEELFGSIDVVSSDEATEEEVNDKPLHNIKSRLDKQIKNPFKSSEKLRKKRKSNTKNNKKKTLQKIDYLSDNAVDLDGQLESSDIPEDDLRSFDENSNFEPGERSLILCSHQGVETRYPEDSDQDEEDISLHDVSNSQRCDGFLSDDSSSTWENENKKRTMKKYKVFQTKRIKTRRLATKKKHVGRSKYRKRSRAKSINSKDEIMVIKKRKRTKSCSGDSDSHDPTFKPTNVKQTNADKNQPDHSKLKCLRTRKVTSYNLTEKDYLEDIIGKMEESPIGTKSSCYFEKFVNTRINKSAGGKRGRPRKRNDQPALKHKAFKKEEESKCRQLRSRTNNKPNLDLALESIQHSPSAGRYMDENGLINIQVSFDHEVKDESQPPAFNANNDNTVPNKSKRGRKPKPKNDDKHQQNANNYFKPVDYDDQSMFIDQTSEDHFMDGDQPSANVNHKISIDDNKKQDVDHQEQLVEQMNDVDDQNVDVIVNEQNVDVVDEQLNVAIDDQQNKAINYDQLHVAADDQQDDVVDVQIDNAVDGEQDDVDDQQDDAVDDHHDDAVDDQQDDAVDDQQDDAVDFQQDVADDCRQDIANDHQYIAVDDQQDVAVDDHQDNGVDDQQDDAIDDKQDDAVDDQQDVAVDDHKDNGVDDQQDDVVDVQQKDVNDQHWAVADQQQAFLGKQQNVVLGKLPAVLNDQQLNVFCNQHQGVLNDQQHKVFDYEQKNHQQQPVAVNHSYSIDSEDNMNWRSYQSLKFPILHKNQLEATNFSTDFESWTDLFKYRKQLEVQLVNSLTNEKKNFKSAEEVSSTGHQSYIKRKDATFNQAPYSEELRREKAVEKQLFQAPSNFFLCNKEIRGQFPVVSEQETVYPSKGQFFKLTEKLPNSTTICLSANQPVLPTKTRINREIILPTEKSNTSVSPSEIYTEDLSPLDLSTKSATPTTNKIKRGVNKTTDKSNVSVTPPSSWIKRDVGTDGINKHFKLSSDLSNRLVSPTTIGNNRLTVERTGQSNRSASPIKIENSRHALVPDISNRSRIPITEGFIKLNSAETDKSNRSLTSTTSGVIRPDLADTDKSNEPRFHSNDLSITVIPTPDLNKPGLLPTDISHGSDLSPTDLSITPIKPFIYSLAPIDINNRSGIASIYKNSIRSGLTPAGLNHSKVPPNRSEYMGQVILPTDLSIKPGLPSMHVNNSPAQVPTDTNFRLASSSPDISSRSALTSTVPFKATKSGIGRQLIESNDIPFTTVTSRPSLSTPTAASGKWVSAPTDLNPLVLRLEVVINGSRASPSDTSNRSISTPSEAYPFLNPAYDDSTLKLYYYQLLRYNASLLHSDYPHIPLFNRSLMSNSTSNQSNSFLTNATSHPRLPFPPLLMNDNLNMNKSIPYPSSSNKDLYTFLNNKYLMDYNKCSKHFCVWCSKTFSHDLLNVYYVNKTNVDKNYMNCFLCGRSKESRESPKSMELVYTKLQAAQIRTLNLSSQPQR